MTVYAAHQFTAQDEAGNVVAGASVEVRSEDTGLLVALYSDRNGSTPLGNPATTDSDGFIRFFVDGGVYKIRVYTGSSGAPTSEAPPHRYVAIGTASEYDRGDVIAVDEPVVVTTSSATIAAGTMAVAVQRSAPSTTTLTLPAVADQDGVPLKIADYSTSVTDHQITLTPASGEEIMGLSSWVLYSTAASLAGVTLIPSTTLGGYYIAP